MVLGIRSSVGLAISEVGAEAKMVGGVETAGVLCFGGLTAIGSAGDLMASDGRFSGATRGVPSSRLLLSVSESERGGGGGGGGTGCSWVGSTAEPWRKVLHRLGTVIMVRRRAGYRKESLGSDIWFVW